jgi:hypothetical protein
MPLSVGSTWQYQLQGRINTDFAVDVYDIDLFDAANDTIAALTASARHVVCYFSAGTYEDWRPDAQEFDKDVIGNPLEDWEGEWYLDIRAESVKDIMLSRMQLARDKGCSGVEPDNVQNFQEDSGFDLTAHDQLVYNQWLADTAHGLGLTVGLKNDITQIADLVSYFDWALNEQCFQYDECDNYSMFIDAGKPVFEVEYSTGNLDFCERAEQMQLSAIYKSYDLDARRCSCQNATTDYKCQQLLDESDGAARSKPFHVWLTNLFAIGMCFVAAYML